MEAYLPILRSLKEGGVEYAVIGTWALKAYFPEQMQAYAVHDCDVVLQPDWGNVRLAVRILIHMGWEVSVWGQSVDAQFSVGDVAGKFYLRAGKDALSLDAIYECPLAWDRMAAARMSLLGMPLAAMEHIAELKWMKAREHGNLVEVTKLMTGLGAMSMSMNTMLKINVQPETEADYAQVYALNHAAFGQEGEARLVDALRKSTAFVPGLSLVAIQGHEVVGHILFTKVHILHGDGARYESLSLAPMAVRPDLQRQGIGGKLVRHGLKIAAELGHASVIVVGHEAYYPRFGFVPADKWGIVSPYDVPKAAFMAVELVPGGLQHVSGTVVYPREFDAV